MPPLVIAAELPGAGGGVAVAASIAVSLAASEAARPGGVLMVEAGAERKRGPTMLASEAARGLEGRLSDAGFGAAARGRLCWLCLSPEADALADLAAAASVAADARAAVAHLPAALWQAALGSDELRVTGGLLRAELPRQRSLAALAVCELRDAGARARVAARAPGPVAARRAASGLEPGGQASVRAARLARGLVRG
jgi:hypothetical protein